MEQAAVGVSIVVPVGPYPANKRWLRECLDSIAAQTLQPQDVIIMDDGADLASEEWLDVSTPEYDRWCVTTCGYLYEPPNYTYPLIYKLPWRTGISHSFNYGVMLALTDCVFMLGSDDTLEPNCLERCVAAYEKNNKEDAYYSVPIRYMDTGEVQTAPCNAAMVTKGFWRLSGGFPIETAIGIGDSTLLSICMAHKLPVHWVGHLTGHDDEPLYNYRRHPDIHTYKLGNMWHIVDPLRGYLTEHWSADEIKQWSERY